MHYFVFILVLRSSGRGRESWLLWLLLSYRCIVTINVLWLFLTVPRVGLQYVIVVFPDHTHPTFSSLLLKKYELRHDKIKGMNQWRSQNAEKLRTSKGDYWIKQWFSPIASLFKMETALKGKLEERSSSQRERVLSFKSRS